MNLNAAKLEELINQPKQPTNACKWRQWYINLTDEEQTTIQTAFNNPEIETSHITRALQEYGCPSSPTTIRSHRRKECKSCT